MQAELQTTIDAPPRALSNKPAFLVAGAGALLVFGAGFAVLETILRLPSSDYANFHVAWARDLAERGELRTPHFLYSALVALASRLPFVSLEDAAYLVVPVASSVGLALAIAWVLQPRDPASRLPGPAAGLLAVALCVVGPVSAWAWPRIYLGFLAPTIFHSPTYTVMQPLAVLLFGLVVRAEGARLGTVAGLAAATVLCALAKPSFVLALVPALVVVSGVDLVRGRRGGIAPVIAVAVAGLLVIAWQYAFVYGEGSSSRIVFAPLLVMGAFSDDLALKLAGSVLFPAALLALYRREALEDRAVRLAWAAFAFGCASAYLLAEAGPRLLHGNLVWSACIANHVLFVASAAFLVRQPIRSGAGVDRRWAVAAALLAVHVANGIVFFGFNLAAPSVERIYFGV